MQEKPLRGPKLKVTPCRRPCATSSAVRRQQATAMGNAATPLCDLVAAVTASSHSACSRLQSTRKPVSRQSQQTQQCTAVNTHAHTANTPLAAQHTCASLPTWNGFIACADVEKEVANVHRLARPPSCCRWGETHRDIRRGSLA